MLWIHGKVDVGMVRLIHDIVASHPEYKVVLAQDGTLLATSPPYTKDNYKDARPEETKVFDGEHKHEIGKLSKPVVSDWQVVAPADVKQRLDVCKTCPFSRIRCGVIPCEADWIKNLRQGKCPKNQFTGG